MFQEPTDICCHLMLSCQPHAGYFNELVPPSSAIRNLWFWLVPQEYPSPKVGWGTSLLLSDFGILCDHREVLGDSVEVHGRRSLLSFVLLKRSFRHLDLEKGGGWKHVTSCPLPWRPWSLPPSNQLAWLGNRHDLLSLSYTSCTYDHHHFPVQHVSLFHWWSLTYSGAVTKCQCCVSLTMQAWCMMEWWRDG
jgi:hypothetical protein